MTRPVCDRESELLRAMGAGAPEEALRTHLRSCPSCQETERAAALLRAYAKLTAADAQPPAAARVWRRAQERRQEAALRRASWAMLAMRAMGVMYVLAVMVWGLRALWQTQPEPARQAMLALRTGTVSMGVGAACLLLAVGAASLLVLGQRRQPSLLP